MSDEKSGFTVVDRRAFSAEGEKREPDAGPGPGPEPEAGPASPAPEEAPTGAEDMAQAQAAAEAEQAMADQPHMPGELPPPDFSGLIISLAHTAMIHLGADPAGEGGGERNLPLARHVIDTLAMLEAKTKGNLTDEEGKLLTNMLTELRLAYVKLSK